MQATILESAITEELLESGKFYLDLGIPLLRIHSVVAGVCTCGNPACKAPGKHPKTLSSVLIRTEDELEDVLYHDSTANLAAVVKESPYLVIDYDPREDGNGLESRDKLIELYGPLPSTLEVLTPSGGKHEYYVQPDGLVKDTQSVLGPKIDVKANGYVLIPGSNHLQGHYQFGVKQDINPLPRDYAELVLSGQYGLAIDTSVNNEILAAIRQKNPAVAKALRKGKPFAEAGARNSTMASVSGTISHYLARKRIYPCVKKLVREVFGASLKAMATEAGAPTEVEATNQITRFLEADRQNWRMDLEITKAGYKNTDANAIIAVKNCEKLQGRLGFDERAGRILWTSERPWDGTVGFVDDNDVNEICELLSKEEHLSLSVPRIHLGVSAAARANSFDRIRDYFDALEWDGVFRASRLLPDYLGAEDTEIHRKIGLWFLIGAVARTYRPGCKNDYMLILQGAQGVGKSRAIEALAPKDGYREVNLAPDKDALLSLHGPLLCEWSELAGLSRREAQTTKAIITRAVDHIRISYGHLAHDYQRRSVLVGSTNEMACLSDYTGGRRYWPIEVGTIDVEKIRADRDMLWAEAVECLNQGVRWWPTEKAEHDELTARQEETTIEDSWVDVLAERLYQTPEEPFLKDYSEASFMKTVDLLDIVQAKNTPFDGKRLRQAMEYMGWRHKKTKTVRGYTRP